MSDTETVTLIHHISPDPQRDPMPIVLEADTPAGEARLHEPYTRDYLARFYLEGVLLHAEDLRDALEGGYLGDEQRMPAALEDELQGLLDDSYWAARLLHELEETGTSYTEEEMEWLRGQCEAEGLLGPAG